MKRLRFDDKCWYICNILSVFRCSFILVDKWRAVSPLYQALQLAQTNLYTTMVDFRKDGILSFVENILPILLGIKTRLALTWSLHNFLMIPFILLWVCLEKKPRDGSLNVPLFCLEILNCCIDCYDLFLQLCQLNQVEIDSFVK